MTRCRCITTIYGGVKRCRGAAISTRGWCRRHEYYRGANHQGSAMEVEHGQHDQFQFQFR